MIYCIISFVHVSNWFFALSWIALFVLTSIRLSLVRCIFVVTVEISGIITLAIFLIPPLTDLKIWIYFLLFSLTWKILPVFIILFNGVGKYLYSSSLPTSHNLIYVSSPGLLFMGRVFPMNGLFMWDLIAWIIFAVLIIMF